MSNNGLLNVQVGGRIDVGDAMFYIKTGQSEIASAVQEGKTELDTHTNEKISEFNTNATNKTTAFNSNYTTKKALIDAEVQTAKDWATKTDGTVDGTDYSAKYYAQSLLPISSEIVAVSAIADDVQAVGAVANKVSAVADDLTAINAVNANKTNIDTVAGSISNVNAVGGNISNVNSVAGNATNINAVNANKTNIDAVAGSISNVNSVGSNISKVNAVYSDLTAIEAVNNNKTNIDTVATNVSAVGNVSANMSKVSNVSNNISHIVAVDNNKTNIDAVAGNATNINKVAVSIVKVNNVGLNISKVTAVADDLTNVDTVAGNIDNVNTVASVSSAVSAVGAIADDLDDVIDNATNITTVAENITDVASVGENIANVNTVAGDSLAINSCANNLTAINNAPTYANNSKIWAEGLDGEVTPLGGTHSAKGWAEIAEQAASGVQNPANRDLSNLTTDGQMIVDSQNGTISNCILEIPQNIKLTLENNVLTLASGSVVALTGYNTYTTRTTTANITKDSWASSWYNKTVLLYIGSTGTWFGFKEVSKVGSGSSLPADNTNFDGFYPTTDYSWYEWENGTWNKKSFSYPLAIVNVDSSGVASFAKDSKGRDMIFNGTGFIGHHAFVYPNIKGLTAREFDTDGSLKSTEWKTNTLQIVDLTTATGNKSILINESGVISAPDRDYEVVQSYPVSPVDRKLYYIKDINAIKQYYSGSWHSFWATMLVSLKLSDTTVTKFDIHQPYEGARNLLTDELQTDVTTLTGYDSTQTQTLKNINGVLQWVTD